MMPRPAAPEAGFTTNSLRSPITCDEAPDVAVAADDGVRFRHRDAVGVANFLGDRLVVDARVESARIALLDERQVAVVDAEHAGAFELVGPDAQSAMAGTHGVVSLWVDQIAEPPQLGEAIAGVAAEQDEHRDREEMRLGIDEHELPDFVPAQDRVDQRRRPAACRPRAGRCTSGRLLRC